MDLSFKSLLWLLTPCFWGMPTHLLMGSSEWILCLVLCTALTFFSNCNYICPRVFSPSFYFLPIPWQREWGSSSVGIWLLAEASPWPSLLQSWKLTILTSPVIVKNCFLFNSPNKTSTCLNILHHSFEIPNICTTQMGDFVNSWTWWSQKPFPTLIIVFFRLFHKREGKGFFFLHRTSFKIFVFMNRRRIISD